jgi:hypothetical protein
MRLAGRLVVLRAVLATRRADRDRRGTLTAQLSGYSTPAQRTHLLALLERYPDDATEELRRILNRRARGGPWDRWTPGRP